MLLFWAANLADENLGFGFSGGVIPATCNVTKIHLHGSALGTPTYTPQSGSCMIGDMGLSVSLGADDWAAINADSSLLASIETSFLTLDEGFIQDNGGGLSAAITQPQMAVDYIPAGMNLNVELSAAVLDLNNGTLLLVFNDIVTMLDPTLIYITDSNETYDITFTGGLANTPESAVQMMLLEFDLVRLKLMFHSTFNTSNVFVVIPSDGVQTMSGNFIPAKLQLNAILPDNTPPEIQSWSLNINEEIATFTFNEPMSEVVGLEQILITNLTNPPFAVAYNLAGSNVSLHGETSTFFTIALSTGTILALSSDAFTATQSTNTFLLLRAFSFIDISSNSLGNATTAIAVTNFTGDTQAPFVESFQVDLFSGSITITFSEPIQTSSFQPSGISLLDAQSNSLSLTSEDVASFSNLNQVVEITLSYETLNQLKLQDAQAATPGIFMSIDATTAEDTAGNPVQSIRDADPLQAALIFPDNNAPLLVGITAATPPSYSLTFAFNEYVNSSTFDETSLSVTFISPSTGSDLYNSFSGGSVESSVQDVITYTFSSSDSAGDFGILYQIAFYSGNMSIDVGFSLVSDLAGTALSQTEPVILEANASDPISPSLISFTLDLTTSELQLNFSEPLFVLNPLNSITIVNSDTSPSNSYSLGDSSYAGLERTSGQSITITLDSSDVSSLLAESDLATEVANTYITISMNFGVDFSGNSLTNTDALQASDIITGDIISITMSTSSASATTTSSISTSTATPVLSSSSSVMMSSSMALDSSSLPISSEAMTTTSSVAIMTTSSVAMTTSSVVMTTSSIAMTTSSIAMTTSSVVTSSVIIAPTSTISMMMSSSSSVVSSTSSSMAPTTTSLVQPMTSSSVVIPSPSPQPPLELINATLDMNDGSLSCVLNTDVDLASIVVANMFTLLHESFGSYTLFSSGGIFYGSGLTEIVIILENNDRANLIALGISGEWMLEIGDGAMADLSGVEIMMQQVNLTFIEDITPPSVVELTLNMDQVVITITFSEPISLHNFNVSEVYLTGSLVSTPSGYRLNTSSASFVDQATVSIYIDFTLQNEIKADVNTATGLSNSFIFLGSSAAVDHSSNRVPVPGIGIQVTEFIPDSTSPFLFSYTLDLNAGFMTVSFSEPVDTSTLNVTGSVVTKDGPPDPITTFAYLEGSLIGSSDFDTLVSVTILGSINDVRLALHSDTVAYLTIESTFIADFAGNPVASILGNNRYLASNIFPDEISPRIHNMTALAISPDDTSITFIFNEYVLLNSLSEGHMALNVSSSYANQSYNNFQGGVWTAMTNDTVTYMFSSTDLNQTDFGVAYLIASNIGSVTASIAANFSTDLYGNVVILPDQPLVYQATVSDITPPLLDSFSLNLVLGELRLTFTEPVVLLAVPGNIQLHNMSADSPITYALISNSYEDQSGLYGDSIAITLIEMDRVALINESDIASSVSDTYLMVYTGLAMDYSANQLSVTGLVQASSVTVPALPNINPSIIQATLDLDAGTLTLVFSLDIKAGQTSPSLMSLTNGTTTFVLDGNSAVSAINSSSIAIELNQQDANIIKILGVDLMWNVSLSAGAVISKSGDNNVLHTVAIDFVVADATSPNVVAFSLDMNSGKIQITFDEPIESSIFNTSALWISGASDSEPSGYQLIDSLLTEVANYSTHFTYELNTTILNNIKIDASVATTFNNTFLFYESNSFQDLRGNGLMQSASGKQASVFVEDITRPSITKFHLDLDSGTLSVTFNEPVNPLRFDGMDVKIHKSNSSNSVDISSSTVLTNANSLIITVQLSSPTLNEVKLLLSEASMADISLPSTFVTDVNDNAVIEILESSPLSGSVLADETSPSVLSLVAGDETDRMLTITFNEYVDPSTWDGGNLVLHLNTSISYFTYAGFSDGTLTPNDPSTSVTYTISSSKFQQPLSIHYQQAYYSGSIGIAFGSSIISDTSSNPASPPASPVFYKSLATDPVTPQLLEFSLDMDEGELTMTFSEEVVINRISGNVKLQDTTSSPNHIYTLTSSAYSDQEGAIGTIFTLNLRLQDIISLDANPDLASDISTTYLYLASEFAVDFSGNLLNTNNNAIQASMYQELEGPLTPSVTSFDLDLDSDQLTLHFDSEVVISTFVQNHITLVNTSSIDSDTQQIRISNVTVLAQGIQTEFRILLSTDQIIDIKRHPICYTADNCYAIFEEGLIENTESLESSPISTPLQVDQFLNDVTPPRLISFPVFDLNSGYFTLIFSEPVNGSDTDFTKVTFSNSKSNPTQSVVLTEGFTSPDHKEIDFQLDQDDLNALKYNLELCTDKDNCWIKLPSFFITDIGSNPFIHSNYQGEASYYRPTVFIPDTTPPILQSFSANMNTGVIVLSFDEVIDEAQFLPSDIALVNAPSGSIKLVLQNVTEVVRTNDGTALQITLTDYDFSFLKSQDLFTSQATAYLYIITEMTDVSGNEFQDIYSSNAIQASIFIGDATSVNLVSFDSFNIDNGVFNITFDEPIDLESIDVTKITLFASQSSPASSFTLTQALIDTDDSMRMNISVRLGVSDRVAIKLISDLATKPGNTYIALGASAVTDSAGNTNTPMTQDSAIRLASNGYTPDTSRAALTSAELNMNNEVLTLVFDDVIVAESFIPSLISLQNQSTNVDSSVYTLSPSSQSSQDNSNIISISLAKLDVDNIKGDLTLATNANTTYVTFSTNIALDIEGRNVIGVSSGSAHKVGTYIKDTTSPQLVSYTLDMDSGLMGMTFDEPILLSSFDPTGLTLNNAASSPTSTYGLTGGNAMPVTNPFADTELVFELMYNDINEIKSRTTLATSSSDTFLMVTGSFATDSSANPISEKLGMSIDESSYNGDTTLPELVSFGTDLRSDGQIILRFSEAVQYTSQLQSTITIQNLLTNPTESFNLDSSESAALTALDEITITLSNAHTNNLVSESTIGSNTNFLYIAIISGGVYDFSGGQNSQGQSIASVARKADYICKYMF